jgi:endonuclease G
MAIGPVSASSCILTLAHSHDRKADWATVGSHDSSGENKEPRRAHLEVAMPRLITDEDGSGTGSGGVPDRHDLTISAEEKTAIAAVLADPVNAWRSEPLARKRAHASMREIELPPGATEVTVDRALERVIDGNDMVLSAWLGKGEQAARTVALIRTPYGPATGFMITDWLMLTNHHVLPAQEVAETSHALFEYAEDDNGAIAAVRAEFDPARCFITGSDKEGGEPDFTIVALAPLPGGEAPGRRFGRVPLVGAVGKVMVGHPVNIVQHPGGNSRQVAFRDNRLLSVEDPGRVIYKTDTAPGSSGSPVFNDRWQLVALHYTSVEAQDAAGVAIDINGQPSTDSTPEHLRHWVANAGIRVSRLVGHLRGLQLEPATRKLVDEALT